MAVYLTSAPGGFSWSPWDQHQELKRNQEHASTSSGPLTPDSTYGTSTEGSPPMGNASTPEHKLPQDLFEWVIEKSLETKNDVTPIKETKVLPKAESKTPVDARKSRNRFSDAQIDALWSLFTARTYLSRTEMETVAQKTKLSYKQVKTWFQNQRAKERKHQRDRSWKTLRHFRKHRENAAPQHTPPYPVQPYNHLSQPRECTANGHADYYQYLSAWHQYRVENGWSLISSPQPMMNTTPRYPV